MNIGKVCLLEGEASALSNIVRNSQTKEATPLNILFSVIFPEKHDTSQPYTLYLLIY